MAQSYMLQRHIPAPAGFTDRRTYWENRRDPRTSPRLIESLKERNEDE